MTDWTLLYVTGLITWREWILNACVLGDMKIRIARNKNQFDSNWFNFWVGIWLGWRHYNETPILQYKSGKSIPFYFAYCVIKFFRSVILIVQSKFMVSTVYHNFFYMNRWILNLPKTNSCDFWRNKVVMWLSTIESCPGATKNVTGFSSGENLLITKSIISPNIECIRL